MFSFYTYLYFSKTYKEVIVDISKADEEKAIGESRVRFEEKLKNEKQYARSVANLFFPNLLCGFMVMALEGYSLYA